MSGLAKRRLGPLRLETAQKSYYVPIYHNYKATTTQGHFSRPRISRGRLEFVGILQTTTPLFYKKGISKIFVKQLHQNIP